MTLCAVVTQSISEIMGNKDRKLIRYSLFQVYTFSYLGIKIEFVGLCFEGCDGLTDQLNSKPARVLEV